MGFSDNVFSQIQPAMMGLGPQPNSGVATPENSLVSKFPAKKKPQVFGGMVTPEQAFLPQDPKPAPMIDPQSMHTAPFHNFISIPPGMIPPDPQTHVTGPNELRRPEVPFLSQENPRAVGVPGVGHVGSRMATGETVNPRTGEHIPTSNAPMNEYEFDHKLGGDPKFNPPTGWDIRSRMDGRLSSTGENPYAGEPPQGHAPLFNDPRMQSFLNDQVAGARHINAANWEQEQHQRDQQSAGNALQQRMGEQTLAQAPHHQAMTDFKELNDLLMQTPMTLLGADKQPVPNPAYQHLRQAIDQAMARAGYAQPQTSGTPPPAGPAAPQPHQGFLESAARAFAPTAAGMVAGAKMPGPWPVKAAAAVGSGILANFGANKFFPPTLPADPIGEAAGGLGGILAGSKFNKMTTPKASVEAAPPTGGGGNNYWNYEGVTPQPPAGPRASGGVIPPSRQLPPPSGPSGKVFNMPDAVAPTTPPVTVAPPVSGFAKAGVQMKGDPQINAALAKAKGDGTFAKTGDIVMKPEAPTTVAPKAKAKGGKAKTKVTKTTTVASPDNPVMTTGKADEILLNMKLDPAKLGSMTPQQRIELALEATGQQGTLPGVTKLVK